MKTDSSNFKRLFTTAFLTAIVLGRSAQAAPTFEQYDRFPKPANGAFVVTGTGLPDGRLLVWNGDNVYVQFTAGADFFPRVAHGYQGDTAFVALSPDGHTALLGQGYAGNLYTFDTAQPADFTPAAIAASVPGHFSGVFLNNHLVLLDVGRLDFSGSELDIIDLNSAKSGAKALSAPVVSKGAKYFRAQKDLVVDKPPFAYSASLAVDTQQGVVYAMDGNTRELRAFSVAALIAAFNTATPLDWGGDGVLIGAAGDFFTGGVAGVQPNGHLVIGGSEGYTLPGGIQIVDPSPGNPANATVTETLDPTGNQDYYYVIYNAYTDAITGITFTGTAYAPQDTFVPVPALDAAGLAVLMAVLGIAAWRLREAR